MSTRRRKEWFDDDSLWKDLYPLMFPDTRFVEAGGKVKKALSLTKPVGKSALDLCCGPGRHSIALAEHGFSVTGVDRTKYLLDKAKARARAAGVKIEWIQRDMRDFVRPDCFDLVLNMFTSFGYFEDVNEDRRVAANVYRSLKEKGVFLIDIMGKEVLARIFRERDWYELDNTMVLEERKVRANWSWMESRWLMIKDGKMDEFRVSHRLYSAAELAALLSDCGFGTIDIYGDLAGTPYDHTAKRLVLVAHKGKVET